MRCIYKKKHYLTLTKVTHKAAQYSRHHVTYAPEKFRKIKVPNKGPFVSTDGQQTDFGRKLTLSLPNATVVEFTVHCQTRLQAKFKGTVDSCLFLTVIRNATLCSLFQNVQGT